MKMFQRNLEMLLRKLLRKNKKEEKRIMVDLYCVLIINGRRTFDQVPKKLQPAVKEQLEAMGLDENGNPIEY